MLSPLHPGSRCTHAIEARSVLGPLHHLVTALAWACIQKCLQNSQQLHRVRDRRRQKCSDSPECVSLSVLCTRPAPFAQGSPSV